MNRPEVSICIITYNQEAFISECLDSILMQQFNEAAEIMVFDDASTDGTSEICRQYANNYPDRITYVRHVKNLGMHGNWLFAMNSARGRFITACEGDDVWVGTDKLSYQYEFLLAHPEISIHGGAAIMVDHTGQESGMVHDQAVIKQHLNIADFYTNNRLVTCTVMFRNPGFDNWPRFFSKASVFDWLLWLYVMKKTGGQAFYDHKVLGRYRVHEGGVFSSLTNEKSIRWYVYNLKIVKRFLNNQESADIIRKKINWFRAELFRLLLKENRNSEAFKLWLSFPGKGLGTKYAVRLLAELFMKKQNLIEG